MVRTYMELTDVLGRSAFEAPEEVDPDPRRNARQFGDLDIVSNTEAPPTDPGVYVQQYDERGYPINPEARAAARRLRRAQNDVLATVGVTVGGNRDPNQAIRNLPRADLAKIEHVVSENEAGLAIAAADLGLMFACLWWAVAIRARLQTFTFYDGTPFWEILKIEFKHWGLWKFIFAGMPAWIVSFLLNMFRSYVLDEMIDWIWAMLLSKTRNKRLRKLLRSVKGKVYQSLNYALFGLALPLQLFSYLQLLGLVPTLAVPNAWSFIPFSAASPIQLPSLPRSFTLKTLLSFGRDILCSPVIIHLTSLKLREMVEPRIYYYLRGKVPIPDNPDYLSLKASQEDDLDSGAIPGIGWTKPGPEITEPSMIISIFNRLNDLSDWILQVFRARQQSQPLPSATNPLAEVETLDFPSRQPLESQPGPLAEGPDIQQPSQPHTDVLSAEMQNRYPGLDINITLQVLDAENVDGQRDPTDNAGVEENEPFITPQNQGRVVDEDAWEDEDEDAQSSRSSTPTPSREALQEEIDNLVLGGLEAVFSNAGPQRPEQPTYTLPITATSSSPPTRPRRTSTIASTSTFPTSRPVTPPDSPLPAHSVRVSTHHASENEDDSARHLEVGTLIRDPNNLSNVTLSPPSRTEEWGDWNAIEERRALRRTAARPPLDLTTTPLAHPPPHRWSPWNWANSDSNVTQHATDQSNPEPAPPVAAVPEHRYRHRVTALSNHPPDSLASHSAALIANVLFLPLDALLLRSLAYSYLSNPGTTPANTATALGLRSDVRGLRTWFGSSGNRLDYVLRVALAVGMQFEMSGMLWIDGMTLVMWVGKRWFEWGRL